MKIRYKNVGSIKDAEVEFKPGQLIAIVGESNQGKSLQFYSLSDGFVNTPDFKKYINNESLSKDKNACESIELIDDNDGSWKVIQSTSSMTYIVNGLKYEKVGRKSIFEVAGLQIPGLLYDPENCTPIMNIVDEDAGMFPIDRSDSQIFKTYERLLSLSCTEDILRTIKLDLEDIDYNVSDRLKLVQQSQTQIQQISQFFEKVDDSCLDKSIAYLEQLKQNYLYLTNLYSGTEKTARYLDKVRQVSYDCHDFDVRAFQKNLELLVNSNKIMQYCIIADKVVIDRYQDFDLQRVIDINQDLSLANMLIKDIESLEEQIFNDTKELEGINSIIKTIKICPLCGHKLED